MMASAQVNRLFNCCSCEEKLTVNAHSLPCLHNLCQTCMKILTEKEVESTMRKCPKCGEEFTMEEEWNLLPYLSTSIKCHSEKNACHFCSKGDTVSTGKHWCHQCEQLFCNNCNRVHRKLQKSHICKDLEGMDRSEWIELVMSGMCLLHGKERALFCEQCNVCFCDTCYRESHARSGCMSASILNVGAEVTRRKSEEGPNLEKEVKEFEKIVKKSSERLRRCRGEVNAEHGMKLGQIWRRYDEIVEIARLEASKLSDDVDRKKCEEEGRIDDWLYENDRMVKQMEIWLVNCEHLLVEAGKNLDIVCGLNLLKSKVRSWEMKWNQQKKEVKIFDKIQFFPDYSNFSLEVTDSQFAVSSSSSSHVQILQELSQVKKLEKHEEWHLPGSKPRLITSIHVAKEDSHVFLCDFANQSLIELSECGKLVNVLCFRDEWNEDPNFVFYPLDICSIAPDMLVVCGVWEGKVFFVERINIPPFMKIKKIFETKKHFLSLCQKDDSIFFCDSNFNISSFTKRGEEMKTIDIDGMSGSRYWCPRIRVNPSSGIFWGSRDDSSEIVSFNSEGGRLCLVKKEEKAFFDFCFDELGHFYFSTENGIFSFFPEKELFKFDKKSEIKPRIFVSENKIFVFVKNDGKYIIKIFKIFY